MSGAIMIQGAGSNVGKSMLVAGLCRAAVRRGLTVRPFKPQNMSNNAAAAIGGEIGRAQSLQARACGAPAHVDMNPVLLKPESERGAQVIVQGERLTTVKARDYAALKPTLMKPVLESFERLRGEADLMIVEGAGSPAEVNLRAGDIANMGFARAAATPVVLVGDIDRGGVIAQIVGTKAVLDNADAAMIQGFIINKFRGDPSLFDDGYRVIEEHTGWRGFGVAPWFADASKLPAEDGADLLSRANQTRNKAGKIVIAAPLFERIANFDDLDPLAQEPEVDLRLIPPGSPLPGDAALVILPGSKSTRGDLAFLRAQGWDVDLQAHHRRGGQILGICGGYQMLGRKIHDPDGLEGAPGADDGLGYLDVETVMAPKKRVGHASGTHLPTNATVQGYEIHMGRTSGADARQPMLRINGEDDGALSSCGQVAGCYLHGLFGADSFRRAFLSTLGAAGSSLSYEPMIEQTLDALAAHLEHSLCVDELIALAMV